jgi:aspartate aminotransferase
MMASAVVTLLGQLMQIPSISNDEHDIGLFLEQHLQGLGYTVERIPISPDSRRCNVYAYLGASRKTRICLTSHMDTVPPHIPMRLTPNTIYGRGSCDDKGPLAAQIIALEELRVEGRVQPGDVSLLFVVGEEKGGPGMIAANSMNLSWEAVVFGEPTEGKLAVGHKGHFVFELTSEGVPAHSGYPQRGRSAISVMTAVVTALERTRYPSSDTIGPSTFHCGQIIGGVGYNILAAQCTALCAVRVASDLPGIERLVEAVVSEHEYVRLDKKFMYPELYLDHDVPGMGTMPVAFGTDAPRLKGEHKKYLYGPGSILVAHGDNERIEIGELIESVQVYKRIVEHCLHG